MGRGSRAPLLPPGGRPELRFPAVAAGSCREACRWPLLPAFLRRGTRYLSVNLQAPSAQRPAELVHLGVWAHAGLASWMRQEGRFCVLCMCVFLFFVFLNELSWHLCALNLPRGVCSSGRRRDSSPEVCRWNGPPHQDSHTSTVRVVPGRLSL